jgi:hypothetical protein
MISYTLRLAAIAGTTIALIATSAMATESALPVRETPAASTVRIAPSIVQHRHSARAIRHATSGYAASRHRNRPDLRVSALRGDLGCSGTWCGRQFVLMIGIGF